MFLGIVYLLLGIGLIVTGVTTRNRYVFFLGVGLGLVGWAFLARWRAERQAKADYQRLMNIINRM